MNLNKGRKAQEEIVGFVLLVVIVMVVMVILLAIFMRKGEADYKDFRDSSDFLKAATEYTTDCAIDYVPSYVELGELISECQDEKECVDGRIACLVLNDTIKSLVSASWNITSDSPQKGYLFEASLKAGTITKEFFSVSEGNCSSGIIRGGEHSTPSQFGTIITRLNICY